MMTECPNLKLDFDSKRPKMTILTSETRIK